jgi:hypothetical protein
MAIKISMGLPPEVARRFVADMDAYHNEPNPIKQEEIAVRQLHALREHSKPRDANMSLADVKALFEQMLQFLDQTRH